MLRSLVGSEMCIRDRYTGNAGVSSFRFALLLSAPEAFWEPSFVHARWLLGQAEHRSLRFLQHFDRPDATQDMQKLRYSALLSQGWKCCLQKIKQSLIEHLQYVEFRLCKPRKTAIYLRKHTVWLFLAQLVKSGALPCCVLYICWQSHKVSRSVYPAVGPTEQDECGVCGRGKGGKLLVLGVFACAAQICDHQQNIPVADKYDLPLYSQPHRIVLV